MAISNAVSEVGLTYANDFENLSTANIVLKSCERISEWKGDILVLAVYSDRIWLGNGKFVYKSMDELDSEFNGSFYELVIKDGFEGLLGQSSTSMLYRRSAKRLAVVGMGRSYSVADACCSSDAWRCLGSTAARLAKQSKSLSLGIAVANAHLMSYSSKLAAIEAVSSGVLLELHGDKCYKSQAKPRGLNIVEILSFGTGSECQKALMASELSTEGLLIAKDLIASPANHTGPGELVCAANRIADYWKDVLTCRILNASDCKDLGMGAFLALANASKMDPTLIHLTYKPQNATRRSIAIVGKGVCYESGGYNIRGSDGSEMELMKYNMGGFGAALGAAHVIGGRQPSGVQVHFISAVCESTISGKGLRPGDIVTACNKKTIEVVNTDGQGRLTLADSLAYASSIEDVQVILDVATLTGDFAAVLGHDVGGLITPDDDMAKQLQEAAKRVGEKLHRLPLVETYRDSLNSPIADLKNSGGPDGSGIKAALFLQEFIKPGMQWAHLDITGPVWDRAVGTASGYGALTLVEWIMQMSRDLANET